MYHDQESLPANKPHSTKLSPSQRVFKTITKSQAKFIIWFRIPKPIHTTAWMPKEHHLNHQRVMCFPGSPAMEHSLAVVAASWNPWWCRWELKHLSTYSILHYYIVRTIYNLSLLTEWCAFCHSIIVYIYSYMYIYVYIYIYSMYVYIYIYK